MIDEDAERYRRLAEALLQRIYPLNRIEARLGALPGDWPGHVTVPQGSAVIGGVTHRRDDKLASMTLSLEGGSSGEQIVRHYEGVLAAEGWVPFTPQMPAGMVGFRSAMPISPARVFCRKESDPFYNVLVTDTAGGLPPSSRGMRVSTTTRCASASGLMRQAVPSPISSQTSTHPKTFPYKAVEGAAA